MTTNAATAFWGLRGGLGRGAFVVAYTAFALLPLLIGRVVRDLSSDFQTELGAALGTAAYGMLLAGFFLSGRFQVISARAGLDAILGVHRLLGFAATALVAAHVVVVQTGYPGAASGAAYLAVAGLVLIIVLAVFRARIGLRYEYWRLTHGIGAVVVAIAGYAHATSDGYYASSSALKIYWALLIALVMGSLLVVHVFRPLGRMRRPYEIVSVMPVAAETWQVAVQPINGEAMTFEPGQYAFFSLHRRPFMGTGHPFSFSSAPSEVPRIEFTVKENGDFTDTIGDLQPGTKVHLDGPYGYLSPGRYRGPSIDHAGLVLIAGGVGISPMISILREGAATKRTKPVHLFYAATRIEDLAYRDEIAQLTKQLNLTVRYILSSPSDGWDGDTGRIDTHYLRTHLGFPDAGNRLYFVCGSTGMLEGVLAALDQLKIAPAAMVHAENFSVYD